MNYVIDNLMFSACLVALPFVVIGIIRKTKAAMQNRIGAPIFQPLFNFIKLLHKGEVISEDAGILFRCSQAVNVAAVLVVALITPWLSFGTPFPGGDLIMLIYLLAVIRFSSMLASLAPGSSFGAFGASREATLSLLVEPVIMLALVALAFKAQSMQLSAMFSFANDHTTTHVPLWLLAGAGLFLSSLVELSRMPVDDPTTHLELTMVHEAMLLENSGRNLAMAELTASIRLCVLYGLSGQCFLHALNCLVPMSQPVLSVLSVAMIVMLALATAVVESVTVKLQWTKAPEFIAYGLTMSLLASLAAIAMGTTS